VVGIVLVSHSRALAEGAAALVDQVCGGAVPVVPAGGTDDGRLGTSADLLARAIAAADRGDGVLIVPDLGSSVLTARALIAEWDGVPPLLVDAPFVEGAVAAAVAASAGLDLDAVARAAREARDVAKF
jgi:dihydroxyacetone kinase phosphotransfer subunit